MALEIKRNTLVKYTPEDGEKIVTVPESVTKIAEHAFGNLFFEDAELEEVILPESLKLIDNWAFNGSSIRRMTIPENVKKIEQGAFKDCRNLEYIQFPEKGCSLNWSTLSGCISLKEAVLPSDMKIIPQEFMRECEKIESVSIPDSVVGIGKSAFSGCKNLKNFKMPEKLEAVYDYAFSGCESLKKIVFSKNLNRIGVRSFYHCNQLETVELQSKKISSIGHACFYYTPLKEITLPQNTNQIWDYAFPDGTLLHFRLPEGNFNIRFNISDWKDRQDEEYLLAFLCDDSVYTSSMDILKSREEIFQAIKKGNYKFLLAVFMMQYHPESELYQAYVKRNIKKIMKLLIDTQDSGAVQNILDTGYITKKNIDEFINYALENQKHEMQILLMNWKHENIKTESIEKQVQKKFKL